MTWLHGDKLVVFDSRIMVAVLPLFSNNFTAGSFLLRIQQPTYLDAGNYTCIVQLPSRELQIRSIVLQRKYYWITFRMIHFSFGFLFPSPSSLWYNAATLRILGAPNVTSNTSALKVELRCEVSEFGLMAANLQWFKEGRALDTQPAKYVIVSPGTSGRVSTLSISELSVSDSGLYYCKLNGTDIYDRVLLQIFSTGQCRSDILYNI